MLRGYYVCLALDTIKIPQERPRLLSNGSLCKKHNRAVVGGSDNESFSQIGGFDGTIMLWIVIQANDQQFQMRG